MHVSLLRDENGVPYGTIATLRDISDMKCAEARLQESEARYRAIVEDHTDYITRFLTDKTLTFVTSTLCRLLELPFEELLGKKFTEFMDDQAVNRLNKRLASITPEHPSVTLEHQIFLPNGTVRWHQ